MKLNNFIQNRGSWPINGQAGKQPFFRYSKLLQKCPSGKYRKKAAFIPSAYLSIINLRGFIKNVGPRDRLRKSFWNAVNGRYKAACIQSECKTFHGPQVNGCRHNKNNQQPNLHNLIAVIEYFLSNTEYFSIQANLRHLRQ